MPLQTIAGEDKQHAELLRLLQAMGEIRRGEETGNPNLEKRDKYLGLSQEFGELLDSMPDIKVSVKYLVQRAENGEGAEYDPYFIEAWEQIYPDFINVLENLTIQLMGDDLAGFKSTHHIWNAIKYLSTEGKPLKDSLKVYDTILPVQPSLDLKGFTVTGIEPSDGILTLGREPDKLEDIVKRASQIGFKRLRTEIDLNNPTDSQSAVLTNYRRKDITPNKGVAAKKNKKGLFERIYNPVTAIPLNFIIGGLPAKIQVWISEKYKKKGLEINSDVCSGYNWMGETVMSAIAAVVCPLTLGLWTVGPTAGYFGYSIIRFIWSAVKDTETIGNALWKIPLLPVELAIRNKENPKKGAKKPENWALMEIELGSVRNVNRGFAQIYEPVSENLHPSMRRLAEVQLDQKQEDNLVYSPKNHNYQGSLFRDALQVQGSGAVVLRELDKCDLYRDLSAITFYKVMTEHKYSKTSALVCYQNRRYAITLVTPNEFEPKELPKLLADTSKPIEERVEGLAKSSRALYAHVTQFEKCQKTADLVWRQG